MDGGAVVEWEAKETSLACRLPLEVPDEVLNAIRLGFLAATAGMGLPPTSITVIPAGWRRYSYGRKTIMIVRDPLPQSLQSEESVMRRRLHDIVVKHLNS